MPGKEFVDIFWHTFTDVWPQRLITDLLWFVHFLTSFTNLQLPEFTDLEGQISTDQTVRLKNTILEHKVLSLIR